MPDGTVFHRAGNFAPIAREHDIPDLPVIGELPRALNGTLFGNGPNPQFPEAADSHWFFGDGMIHAFTLRDGRAAYRNRWVRTHKWQAERAAGRALLPCYPKPSLAGLGIRDSGVANTNVVWHAGKLLALEEGHLPFELDPHTLDTRGVERFRGCFDGPFTAHPKHDPATGELLFFGCSADGPLTPVMHWGTVQPCGRIGKLERFCTRYCAMVHDFAVTARHVLFPVMPLTGSLWRALATGQPFRWQPELGGHVGLMRRAEGVSSLRWFRAESRFVFHVMNAWDEEDGRIVADVMQFDAPPLLPGPDGSTATAPARLARWTLDPDAGTDAFATDILDETPAEFPRFDECRTGLRNRFGAYAVSSGGGVVFDGLAWRDLQAKRADRFALPPGDGLSEPVFVPRAPDAPEGDGWLLTVAWRAEHRRSELLVLDTQHIGAGPVARIPLPHRVPFGFHGNWVPATQ
ncbi:carotenoid oxygenase [Falsiroseomonas bella]|uniref:Dioxygenase n=1 Tax=Falsiroseomonas bella TaxID=2184016 RepID=A0A317F8U7_9PROT|nr:carotenoid oxygenase family protein [Falsiroseomonas bella]PWS34853.1 carotenoid oxygenase [Falsiroseomonas bella]